MPKPKRLCQRPWAYTFPNRPTSVGIASEGSAPAEANVRADGILFGCGRHVCHKYRRGQPWFNALANVLTAKTNYPVHFKLVESKIIAGNPPSQTERSNKRWFWRPPRPTAARLSDVAADPVADWARFKGQPLCLRLAPP